MKRMQKLAILLFLIEELRKQGILCGEMYIQKAVYHLQTKKNVKLDYDFILYKQSFVSFDLRYELAAMRSDELIDIQVNKISYGYSFVITEYGQEIIKKFPVTLSKYRDFIIDTVKFIDNKGYIKGFSLFEKEKGKRHANKTYFKNT